MTYGRVDATDMYRAALVQAVAALDAYVHGVVLDYGVEILAGRRSPGRTNQVGLHFGAVSDILNSDTTIDLELRARLHVAERLSRETFQKLDDIAKAFSMVGVGKLWSVAFGNHANFITTALSLTVSRRNQIVHSCDVDPLNPLEVVPLTDEDALSAAGTVREVVNGIDLIV